jgi:hypothetical protein
MEVTSTKLNERSSASDLKQRVSDVLTFGAFTPLVDAWNRDPDPKKITWFRPPRKTVGEALGYGSVEACQRAADEMHAQLMLLTVCGEVCAVRNDVVAELRAILGR